MWRTLPRAWRWTLIAGALVALAMGGANLAFGTPSPEIRARMSARASRANLERIGAALLEYAERHGDGVRYPDSLEALFTSGILADRGVLECPSSAAAGVVGSHLGYAGGLALDAPCPAAFEHQTLVVVWQRGLPESYQGATYAYGLKTDLTVFTSREDLEVRARGQAEWLSRLGASASPDGAALTAQLRSADGAARRLAAWRLAAPRELEGVREPPPLDPALRPALEDALGAADPELALYAGLALASYGDSAGVRVALAGLEQRLRWTTGETTWLVAGPRRRVLIDALRPLFSPAVQPFAYDPEPAQLAAFAAWRAALEEGSR